MYSPFVYKLPNITLDNKTITPEKDNVVLSSIVPYPLFTLGFHSFFHRTRNAIDITKNIKTNTEFYYVVNPFENKISNYEDDIVKSNKVYLKESKDYSNDFNKLWEVLFVFDVTSNNQNIQIIGNDELEDCVKIFKEKTNKSTSRDKFVKASSCDLIISNYKKSVEDKNFIEQESYLEFLDLIINVMTNLSDKGNAIIQFYDTFTLPTIKMIYILQSFFEEAFVYKPYTSRHSDNDKYLILKNFKGSKKDIIKSLESASKNMTSKSYLADIFPELVVSKEYLNLFKFINIKLMNYQQIMINDIVKYIKENNYFGDKYHTYRDKQIESSKWWISNFYPPSVNLYEKNKEELGKIYKAYQVKLSNEYQKFSESLI